MKLLNVKIENYKSIFNTEQFTAKEVTCLVGKNEAGKTAILQSIYKLNPIEADKSNYDALEEYPRSNLTEYEEKLRKSEIDNANVLSTQWQLSDEEIRKVEEIHGSGSLNSNIIEIKKGYDNIKYWTFDFNIKKIIEYYLSLGKLDKRKYKNLFDCDEIGDFIKQLKAVEEKDEEINKIITEVDKKLPEADVYTKPKDILSTLLPKFIYFSEYYIMPGKIAIDELRRKEKENKLEIKDKVFLALMDLAGTTKEEIDQIDKFDRLDAKLQAVSSRLSKEIFEYWSQNDNLKVQFRYDNARKSDPAPYNSGYIFRTSIFNITHDVGINFDERSSGFIWFFSFLVWFSQIRNNYGNNLIILLDEPALNLHAKAQADLLRYINEKLKPTYQVLYTTHSPFMVDPNNLASTLTVEDIVTEDNKILGSKVKDNIYGVDKETLFPLQAALGYNITQSLFIGKNSLLVEGSSDMIYIKWISTILKENKRIGLTEEWTITPVGGLDKIGSFIALFGANNLNIAVLTDFHKGEKNKIRTLKESDLLKTGQFLSAEMYTKKEESDIEDVLGREFYIELINKCYNLTSKNKVKTTTDENTPIRVVEEIENHFRTLPPEIPEFNHFKPALFLLENSEMLKKELPGLDDTMNRFEEIFRLLNSFLNIK